MLANADIIKRWYKDIWEGGQWDKISAYYTPAQQHECLIEGENLSRDDTRELIVVLHEMISDHHVKVLHTVEDQGWISALVQLDGASADTGMPVSIRWQSMVRISGDQIVESYPSFNFLSFFEQLGQLPKNTFELLLSGTVLK